MKYKKEFEGQNVWVDKVKSFLGCNQENQEILFKFIPNIFENDVTDTASEPKPISTNVKRKSKRKLS
jgi:hypothetical protein